MLEAAIAGLQRHGVSGMSFTDVLNESGAARGAIYHHFPGGKTQLVSEAGTASGEQVRAALAALPGATPQEVVQSFLALVRPVVAHSAAGGGCAVAALTVGAERSLCTVAASAFNAWAQALAQRLSEAGLDGEEASALAAMLLAQLEGAHILCRAAGSVEPFDRAARAMLALIAGRPIGAAAPSSPAG